MDVAHVVSSIISAFGNGMDLFRRLTGKKSKRRGREPTYSEEELWLRDSLDRRPREIRDSYDRSVARLGHRFEIGDTIAHTSLAHTLLVLNSGLINLINQALSADSKRNLSRRSLLNLSEVAAADTLNALSQLSLRLSSQSQLTLPPPQRDHKDKGQGRKTKSKSKSKDDGAPTKKRPGPVPLLVAGGWVRPKSGSIVSASSTGSKGGARHARSKSESAVSKVSKAPLREARQEIMPPIDHARQQSWPESRQPQRQPSMLVVPSDFFLPFSEEPQSYETPPPRPPKIPLDSRPNPGFRPRPPSQRTFMTVSTKIGEIPEGRSQPMPTFSKEVQDPRLVQYLTTLPGGDMEEEPRKKVRGFRFWKKTEKTPVAAAY